MCDSQIEEDEALFALIQTFPDNLNTVIALNVGIFGLERAFQLTPTMQATNISNNGVLALSKFLNEHPNVSFDTLQIGKVSFEFSFEFAAAANQAPRRPHSVTTG